MELAVEEENRRVRERSPGSPWPVASIPVPAASPRPPETLGVPGPTGEYDSELVEENSHARESVVDLDVFRGVSLLVPGWGWAVCAALGDP